MTISLNAQYIRAVQKSTRQQSVCTPCNYCTDTTLTVAKHRMLTRTLRENLTDISEPNLLDDEQNKVADGNAFHDLCEQFLPVKPSLSQKGCVRLGRIDRQNSQNRPRRLLVHLTNENCAQVLLANVKRLRRFPECAGIYINPDLCPAEAKIAYENRQRRRANAHTSK